MTPEERQMLQETRDMVHQNNEILKSIQRSNRISAVLKVFYWLVIIGLSVGALYFIQPYVDTLKSSLNDIGGSNMSSLLVR